ncbi:MAG: thymidine phosphorylase [Actinomycetota bacterium]|jgi:thymidine phosphorylase|nr:thymidine phosphorylase [Actinomycetota bacterium]
MSPQRGDGQLHDAVELIRTKRDGGALPAEAVHRLMEAYVGGGFAEEQMAALLMAVVWRGMTAGELAAWTDAMLASGSRLDLSGLGRPTVDKHSTGGVGDKISLVLVPLVAAFGAAVPQMSGRGLGHTGGTLDKMDAIAGWRSNLSPEEVLAVLGSVGCVITAASAEMVPADRRLYALRDVTATVESIPLVVSSIMSKKIAEGTSSLLLDVKVGSGAFMTDLDQARKLASTLVDVGSAHGVRCAALLTGMDTPIGRTVGNALEVAEALEVLDGGGPDDLRDLVVSEANAMLQLAGIEGDPAAALTDGRARRRFEAMVEAQGGDLGQALPAGRLLETVRADRSGFVRRLEARAVGMASFHLGAGRSRPGDGVSMTAGVVCRAKPGDEVTAGQPVLELWGDDPARVELAKAALLGALELGDLPPSTAPLVLERIGC